MSPKRTRGRPIVVPRWWLDEAKRRADASGLGLILLGESLAKTAKRALPWNHGSISRFLSGERVTDDLVQAFVERFDMPRPVYYPRDIIEAIAFKEATERRAASQPAGVQNDSHTGPDVRLATKLARISAGVAGLKRQRQSAVLPTIRATQEKVAVGSRRRSAQSD